MPLEATGVATDRSSHCSVSGSCLAVVGGGVGTTTGGLSATVTGTLLEQLAAVASRTATPARTPRAYRPTILTTEVSLELQVTAVLVLDLPLRFVVSTVALRYALSPTNSELSDAETSKQDVDVALVVALRTGS